MTPQRREIPQRRKILVVEAVLCAFIFASFIAPVYSEEPRERAARGEGSAEEVRIEPENIEKTLPAYNLSLKKLIAEAEKNINRIDAEIKKRETLERNKQREAEARACFDRGNVLSAEGKLEEAKAEWKKAVNITRDPEMKNYIRQNERKAREEDRARKKEEAERQKRLAAEQKEAERLAAEKARAEEKARIEADRKACEETRRLEAEARKKAAAETKVAREAERKAKREFEAKEEADRAARRAEEKRLKRLARESKK